MRPSAPQPPRRPSRPGRASSSAPGRCRVSVGHRRSPEGRPSSQRPSSDTPNPASRRALTIAHRRRRRRRTRSRFLYGTIFVAALALVVVGLRVWGLYLGFILLLGSSARQPSTPAKATAQSSARVSATRTASPSASVTPPASPTPSASTLPSPQLDSEGFTHPGAVGSGSWAVAPAVLVSRPVAATIYRYVLRVEGSMRVGTAAAAPVMKHILNDGHGWPTAQNTSFQPVADPTSADFTSSIATPSNADALCLPLDTGGMWSCHDKNNVVINSDRRNWGVVTYPDVDSYRTYVTNHEMDHSPSHEREFCAGARLKAPLMARQSHDLAGGCAYNV